MTIEEAVELYNKTKNEIASLEHISDNLTAANVERLTDVELSLVRAFVLRRKHELINQLKQTFKV